MRQRPFFLQKALHYGYGTGFSPESNLTSDFNFLSKAQNFNMLSLSVRNSLVSQVPQSRMPYHLLPSTLHKPFPSYLVHLPSGKFCIFRLFYRLFPLTFHSTRILN